MPMNTRLANAYRLIHVICTAIGIPPDRTQRLVIDIKAGDIEPIRIYTQMLGDERLLDVDWSLEGVKVHYAPYASRSLTGVPPGTIKSTPGGSPEREAKEDTQ